MDTNDLIQVLWVEDDKDVTSTYPIQAEAYGLHLVPFSCGDDGRAALDKEYSRWSAIILDAKCKHHIDSADNAIRFLGNALKDIAAMSKERGRIIPWYVLTAGDESNISDSINEDRNKWDADWTEKENKVYYSKNTDRKALFERIRTHAQKSARIQVQEMYRDYYNQLSDLHVEVCDDILTILETMHFPNSHPDFAPRRFYNPLRKALEYVFRATRKIDLIPNEFFDRNKVNLNQCFMYVIGNDASKLGYKHGGGSVVPSYIQDMMSLIVHLGNANSHSFEPSHSTELSDDEIEKYENNIKSIGANSRILLFSMALQFYEILQWTNNYIREHQDKEANKKNWIRLTTNEETGKKAREGIEEGIIERDENGYYHIGSNYSVYLNRKELLGKKVKIISYKDNTNEKTKNLYKRFVLESDLEVLGN